MRSDEQLQVWFDGNCSVCQRSREWCEARDTHQRLWFMDFRAATADQLPVPQQDLESSMWVRDTDGELIAGFEGWRRIVLEMPRWRWLSHVAGIVPIRFAGRLVYSLLARFRHLLPARPNP